MTDPFVFLTPVLVLAVIALLRFVGCDALFGVHQVSAGQPTLALQPPPGGYLNPPVVALVPSETADIYYTTDGSTPTIPPTGSTKKFDPMAQIPISTDTTINAVLKTSDGRTASASGNYLIGPMVFQQLAESEGTSVIAAAAFAATVPARTLIVVWIWYVDAMGGTVSVQNVTDSTNVTLYQRAAGPTPSQSTVLQHRQEIWYGVTQADTMGLTVTATFSPPPNSDVKSIHAHAYSHPDLLDSTPLDVPNPDTASATGVSTSASTMSLMTTAARLVFGAAVFVGGAGTPGTQGPQQPLLFRGRSNVSGNVSEDADVSMPGQSVTATFDNPGSVPWIAQMCVFR